MIHVGTLATMRGRRPSIRARLLIIAWLPSFTLLIVGVAVASVLSYQGQHARSYSASLRVDAPLITREVSALELEWQLTANHVAAPGPVSPQLAAARRELDQAVAALSSRQGLLTSSAPQQLQQVVAGLRAQASKSTTSIANPGEVARFRQDMDAGRLSVAQIAPVYSQPLAFMDAVVLGVAQASPSAEVMYDQIASADLLGLITAHAQAAALIEAASRGRGLDATQYQALVTSIDVVRNGLPPMAERVVPALRASVAAVPVSAGWKQEGQIQTAVLNTRPREGRYVVTLPMSRDQATAAGQRTAQQIDALFHGQFAAAAGNAEERGRDQFRRSLTLALVLMVVSVMIFLLTTKMSRTLIGRLRLLRDRTLELADVRLPGVIARMRDGELVDIGAEIRPIDSKDDEIGQVSDAFGKAQRTALDAAESEVETRAGSAKVFLNIAHRSQSIVHQQIRLLDEAERRMEDPDQLQLLFELDHLATRARRNAENLIIMGGGQPGRQWRRPIPLTQVVQSAIGESEWYVRVLLGELPPVLVDGRAVADVVHLLAELLDNATNYSPPTARVEVRSTIVGRGLAIEIEDQGLGIEPAERDRLNDMLHEAPDFGLMALSGEPRLGLFVVARLAARHDITVSLMDVPQYGGTRAVVLLPSALLNYEVTPESTGDQEPGTWVRETRAALHRAAYDRVEALPSAERPPETARDPFLLRPDVAIPKASSVRPLAGPESSSVQGRDPNRS